MKDGQVAVDRHVLEQVSKEMKEIKRDNHLKSVRLKMFDDMMEVMRMKPKEMGYGECPQPVDEVIDDLLEQHDRNNPQ